MPQLKRGSSELLTQELPSLPFPSRFISKLSIRYALSALSGGLMWVCFPLVNWSKLVWVACLPLLLAVVAERSLFRGFVLGYSCGAVFLTGSCYWFVGVMEGYGKLSLPLAVGVLLLFVMVFSTFFGFFGLAEIWVAQWSPGGALALSPFLWVSLELARTYLMTGFPWNLLGYAVTVSGLRQLASVTAVYGLSFLAVATSALLVWALVTPRRRPVWVVVGIWLILLAAANALHAPPPVKPGLRRAFLLQPNVPLRETVQQEWAPWRDPKPLEQLVDFTLQSVPREASHPAAPPIVVWAENPAPFYFSRDPLFRGAVEKMARQTRAYVIVNTVNFADRDNYMPQNSAMVLDAQGRVVLQYDKIHLVPFGEYVPNWAFPGKVGKITAEVGNFVPGSGYRVAETPEGGIGVFVCYEAIFPQLVRRIASAGAGVLVNISNDAWYGDSSAADQHLEMARLRAVENGRYLLRATNDGITAVIDPYGRVVDRLPRHRRMVLAGRFDYFVRRTFYTEHGDIFAWLCVAAAAGISVARAAMRRKARGSVTPYPPSRTERRGLLGLC